MKWLIPLIVASSLIGQSNFLPAPGATGGAMPGVQGQPAPPKMRMLALQVTNEEGIAEPFIDPEIKWFKDVLPRLPYNTFTQIAAGEAELKPGEVALMPVDKTYDVYLNPQGQTPTGELQVKIRIAMASGAETVDAVRADCQVAPNQVVVFQGLEHEVGEMVCVLGLSNENDEEDSGQDQQQQDQQDQQPPEEQSEDQEDQQGEQQEQQQNEEQNQDQQQPEEPRNRQEIEAILDMLEATDKLEQQDNKVRRDPLSIRNPWW